MDSFLVTSAERPKDGAFVLAPLAQRQLWSVGC